MFFIGETNNGGDGAEDLFLRDAHLVADVGEYCGLEKIATLAHARAARDQSRAFALADVDVVQHPLHLHGRYQRTHGGGAIARIADAHCLGAFAQPLDYFIVDGILRQDARAGRAHLAGVEEDARRWPL